MDDDLKQNLTAAETWIRGLFILLFAFLLMVARVVTGAVVVIQFLFTVFSGRANENLQYFGASLARFVYQALLFVTYNSDDKPFPFSAWPDADAPGVKAASVKGEEGIVARESVVEESVAGESVAAESADDDVVESSESTEQDEHDPRA